MLEVMAFEGNPSPQDGITWGTAAIYDGHEIVNSLTRLPVSRQEIDAMIGKGILIPLPQPIILDDEFHDENIIIVRADRSEFVAIVTDSLAERANQTIEDAHYIYFCFSNKNSYRIAAANAIDDVIENILYEDCDDQAAVTLLRIGLTLDSSSPGLNAIWAYQNREKKYVKQLAEGNILQGNGDLASFRKLFTALCDTSHPEVDISYDGGEASESKFSLPTYSRLYPSWQKVYSFKAIEHQERYPFLRDVKSPEVSERKAASIHWKFLLSEEGDSLGDILARVMVWNSIQEVLTHGEIANEATVLFDAYQTIVTPSPGTQLTLSAHHEEPQIAVPLAIAENSLRWSKQLSRSDAQIKTRGGKIQYLRFTQSGYDVDYRTWFRDCLFQGQDWHSVVWERKAIEGSKINFDTSISGIYLGTIQFNLTHDPDRANSHGHPPTWLHWNDQLLSALHSGYYANYWVWIERLDDRYNLTIDAVPPPWAR